MHRLSVLLTLVVFAACSDDTSTADLGTADQGPPMIDQTVAPDGPTTPDSFWVPDSPSADAPLPDTGAQDSEAAPDSEAKPDKSPPPQEFGPGQCQTHCDCTQGLMCTGGMCIPGFVPVYCCPKPGCPSGQLCYNPDGSQGNCP